MKYLLLLASTALLTGCLSTIVPPKAERLDVKEPAEWVNATPDLPQVGTESLQKWWTGFNDPTLDRLVDLTLAGSPDRGIARARLMEARGLRRATRSTLFPQLDLRGGGGRQHSVETGVGNVYEAGFDASFELDLFDRNQSAVDAANATLRAREAEYHQSSLTLIAEVARTYVEIRTAEKQEAIAEKNLVAQEKTLDLITHQKNEGEAPQLDVERAEGFVNTTRSEIPEYQRLAENARLRLSVLTGQLPADLKPILAASNELQPASIRPVITTSTRILALRPDVLAAAANLAAQTSLTQNAIADAFPRITLGAFFGVQDAPIIDPTRIWSATINAAVSLLNFGRIRGNIEAAQAREEQAYENWRKTVLQAVTDVETALSDYARTRERTALLNKAAVNAASSLDLSDQLYREGEISFLDVLDAQRTRNDADAAVVSSNAAESQALIALYKALGVY